MFEIERHFDGCVVFQPTSAFTARYVKSYRKGKYTFTTDYSYAKIFTDKTARKHADTLNERG